MSDRSRSSAPGMTRARIRITIVTLLCLVVVLVAGAAAVARIYRHDLIRHVDDRLVTATEQIGRFAGTGVTSDQNLDPYLQTLDDAGAVSFAGHALAGLPPLWQIGDPTGPHDVRTAAGRLRVIVADYRSTTIVLAAPLAPLDDQVRALRDAMLVAVPALLAGFGLVIWFAVGRALRPVSDAVERERQLLADASHELRSPLAGIRVLLETEPDHPDAIAANRRQTLQSLRRLEAITDQLLRLEASGARAPRDVRPVDLDDLVHRAVAARRDTSPCSIDVSDVVAAQALGHEADLESVCENLLANAVRHASGRVKVSVHEVRGLAVLCVEDDGPGIPGDDRDRVFERFTRLDQARARDSGGSGLGLAIVKAIVTAHRGTVHLDESPLGGARFTVSLPATTIEAPGDVGGRR